MHILQHCASCWANFDVIDVLLIHNVNVNAVSNGKVTPLHLALNSDEDPKAVIESVKKLLNAPSTIFIYLIFLIVQYF